MEINKKKFYSASFTFAVIIIFLVIGNYSRQKYVQEEFMDDAIHYVKLAYHIADKGIYSSDGIEYSYSREPLSSFIQAGYLKIFTPSSIHSELNKLLTGRENLLRVNAINLIYLLAISLAMWWVGCMIFHSHFWSMLAIVITDMYLAFYANYLITINSEMLSILLLVLLTGSLIKFTQFKDLKWAIWTGVIMGLLVLTKAVFYYLLPFYLLGVLILMWNLEAQSRKKILTNFLAICISYFLIIFPWMFRNHIHFDDFSIAERGGQVLLIRAIKNQMTEIEYKGGYYAYAPQAFNKLFLGKILDFKEYDLTYGGKLQRLNRGLEEDQNSIQNNELDKLISYYQRAHFIEIPKLFKEASRLNVLPEELLKSTAFKMIKSDFITHLKMSILFNWRGIWIYKGQHFLVALANLFLFVSFYFVFAKSLIKRDMVGLTLCLLTIYYILFHSFLTHYIPRYSVILLPILSLASVLLVMNSFNALKRK